jgi:ribosomal protein S18 acetylase RimI-like enzyme
VPGLRIVDVLDATDFALIPPCVDPRFDHRTCDYWEDADRGARDARPALLTAPATTAAPRAPISSDNPFAPGRPSGDRRLDALAALLRDDADDDSTDEPDSDPFLTAADDDVPGWNPFAPATDRPSRVTSGSPRKLNLLSRGEAVFGSYARVAIEDGAPVAYAQFGPLSAYPRARRIRELYPQLPAAPLPAVITCIAATAEARGRGIARRLVDDVCLELERRGFSAIEVYPDLTQPPDATSAAVPGFWVACGFTLVVDDERFPVLRLGFT